jgi:hypothetical protein
MQPVAEGRKGCEGEGEAEAAVLKLGERSVLLEHQLTARQAHWEKYADVHPGAQWPMVLNTGSAAPN